ncbi:MAG TPA: hypothetical protein VLE51_01635 [Candidatus Saccharimonadales bacterium]|nr:hypothetical protein [Candidatus Saccharimonadales bacterium]
MSTGESPAVDRVQVFESEKGADFDSRDYRYGQRSGKISAPQSLESRGTIRYLVKPEDHDAWFLVEVPADSKEPEALALQQAYRIRAQNYIDGVRLPKRPRINEW